VIELLTQRYRKRIQIDPTTGCWLWQGAKTSKGRGCVLLHGQTVTTHKLFFILFIGPIPDGFEVHHKCNVAHCCNPEHLVLKTRLEHRRLHPDRRSFNGEKTHCLNGHPFSEQNTYVWGGSRGCKLCRKERSASLYQSRKETNG
jgi:hypothetical protein